MKNILPVFVCCCLFPWSSSADWSNFYDFKPVYDESQLRVSFYTSGPEYRRTESLQNSHQNGWAEFGTWQATEDAGVAEVRVFMVSLYGTYAFNKKNVQDLKSDVRDFLGQDRIDFGEQGVVKTNSGPIEYVFYKTSGQACVFIRKYWSDPRTASDASRATALKWVAGTSLVQALSCLPGRENLQLKDLNLLFNGITAREVYWPDSMFASSDGSLGGGTTTGRYSNLDIDISGTYVSDITSNSSSIFPKEYRKIVITFEQDGNNVIGKDSTGKFTVSGSRNGNYINFITGEMGYHKCMCNHIAGSWRIVNDGKKLEGLWDRGAGFKGTWNLTRVE